MEETTIAYSWLLAGVFLLLTEAFGFPGIGLMFAGLGALTTGFGLYFGWLAAGAVPLQFAVFFIASALWAALLWNPIQKRRLPGKTGGYSNIIGDTAYVGSEGLTRHKGEVTWSGTIMKARLTEDADVDRMEAGSAVTIVAVSGTTLMVKPKA